MIPALNLSLNEVISDLRLVAPPAGKLARDFAKLESALISSGAADLQPLENFKRNIRGQRYSPEQCAQNITKLKEIVSEITHPKEKPKAVVTEGEIKTKAETPTLATLCDQVIKDLEPTTRDVKRNKDFADLEKALRSLGATDDDLKPLTAFRKKRFTAEQLVENTAILKAIVQACLEKERKPAIEKEERPAAPKAGTAVEKSAPLEVPEAAGPTPADEEGFVEDNDDEEWDDFENVDPTDIKTTGKIPPSKKGSTAG